MSFFISAIFTYVTFPCRKKTNKNFALFSIFEILKTLNERHVFYSVDYDNNGELFVKKKTMNRKVSDNMRISNIVMDEIDLNLNENPM